MEIDRSGPFRVPVAFAVVGVICTLLAAIDKVVGLVNHPLQLATGAYVSFLGLLVWTCVRGLPSPVSKPVRISAYAAFLLLNLLTAVYVFAYRVSVDPTPVLLHAELARGDALLNAGDKDGAHLIYRAASQRFPNSFPVLMRLGAVNYQMSDYERARRYFSRAVEAAPRDSRWRALNDLGQTLWKLGKSDEAIQYYEQAREAGLPQTELLEWHYRLGWASFDAGNYDQAIEHYGVVAREGSRYAAASYYNISCAMAQKVKQAQTPEARRHWIQAAVDNLRHAWAAATTTEERESLLGGAIGNAEERDPELESLRGTKELQAFLREVR